MAHKNDVKSPHELNNAYLFIQQSRWFWYRPTV